MIIRRKGHCYTTLWIPHHVRRSLSRLCPRIFVKGSLLQSTDNLHLLQKTNLSSKPTMFLRIFKVTKQGEEQRLPANNLNKNQSIPSQTTTTAYPQSLDKLAILTILTKLACPKTRDKEQRDTTIIR